jgi:hypothetical protein
MLDAGRRRTAAARLHHTTTRSNGAPIRSMNVCRTPKPAGVVLALENHWGLTTQVDGLLRIYKVGEFAVAEDQSADTGNFVGDPYPQLETLAPHAMVVQAKTYYGGGVYYTRDLDYKRMAKTLRNAELQRLCVAGNGRQRKRRHRCAEKPGFVAQSVCLN